MGLTAEKKRREKKRCYVDRLLHFLFFRCLLSFLSYILNILMRNGGRKKRDLVLPVRRLCFRGGEGRVLD